MKKIPILSLSLLVAALSAAGARAQTAPAANAPAAGAPAMQMPKPAPELDQLKWMAGLWKCTGKAPAGPFGPEHGYKATFKFAKALDDFWWSGEYDQQKSKSNPMPIHAHGFFTWDSSTKKFMGIAPDNSGGYSVEQITWDGTTWTGSGEETMGAQKMPVRETIVKKTDKEVTWKGEMKMGPNWVILGEDTCKK